MASVDYTDALPTTPRMSRRLRLSLVIATVAGDCELPIRSRRISFLQERDYVDSALGTPHDL